MIKIILSLTLGCAFFFVPAALVWAESWPMNHQVTAQLILHQDGANHFEIENDVNTLTSILGTLSNSGSVDLSGDVLLELNLVQESITSSLSVTGVRFLGGRMDQTSANFQYPIETGMIEFDADPLNTRLESTHMSEFTPVDSREFSPASVRLIQDQGEASIGVPEKPSMVQALDAGDVVSSYNPSEESMAIIDLLELTAQDSQIAQFGANWELVTFQVDVRIPLAGQSLTYQDVGLPSDLTYIAGELEATGSFEIYLERVPEPSSFLLGAIALMASLVNRPRRSNRTRRID